MAQKRMIDRAIVTSERVADLPVDGQLLFDRMILAADDFSLLKKSERWIKHQCLPYVDQVDVDRIQELLPMMMKLNLISIFQYLVPIMLKIFLQLCMFTPCKDRLPLIINRCAHTIKYVLV